MPRPITRLVTAAVVAAVLGSACAPNSDPGAAPTPAIDDGSADHVPARPVPTDVVAVEEDGDSLAVRRYPVVSEAQRQELLARLAERPGVVVAGRDARARASQTTPAPPLSADPDRPDQWGLSRLEAEKVWQTTRGAGQVVAVVDTGVDASHPDLAAATLAGFDALDPAGDGRRDPSGHGTHVAGIVAAAAGNGVSGAGLAPAARILPIRVLDARGEGLHSDIATGVIWAADHGASVINLSLGGDEDSDVLRAAVAHAHRRGVVVVAASGNSAGAGNPVMYPAAYPEVLAVGATTIVDSAAMFSSYGPHLDLAAPGMIIVSTWPGGTETSLSGTSMAAPFVAATAALVRAAHPSLSAAAVRSRLEASAQDLGPAGPDERTGAGLVDVVAAVGDGSPRPPGSAPRLRPTLPTLPALPSPGRPTRPAPRPSLPAPSLPGAPGTPSPTLPERPGLRPPPTLPTPAPRPSLPAPTLPSPPTLPPRPTPATPPPPAPRPATPEPTTAPRGLRVALARPSAPAPAIAGAPVALSGRLSSLPVATTAPLAGRPVVLERAQGRRWLVEAVLRSGADGTVSSTVRPAVNSRYRLRHPAEAGWGSAISRPLAVAVAPRPSLAAAPAAAGSARFVLSGTVSPSGAPVVLERRLGGAWERVEATDPEPSGRFVFAPRRYGSGASSWRVTLAATSRRVAGSSPVVVVRR